MPELPEVATIVSDLNKSVRNQIITSVDIYWPGIIGTTTPQQYIRAVTGQKILNIQRLGKYIIYHLSNNIYLVQHLRMSGRVFVQDKSDLRTKHTHITFTLANNQQIRFIEVRKFGRIELVSKSQLSHHPSLQKLGPDPLLPQFSPQYLYKITRTSRIIKSLLLDQTKIAGLGNIYIDEVLFLSKLHPQTVSISLTKQQTTLLYQNIIEILHKAILDRGTTFRDYRTPDGQVGNFSNTLTVYGRTTQPCQYCQTKIIKVRVSSRGTHICPNCQKPPQKTTPSSPHK